MTWYSESWKRRYPLTMNILAGPETSGSYDIEVVFPADWDEFWENIRSDGFDIVLVDPMGSLQTFRRTAFNFANRQLTLAGQSVTFGNRNSVSLLYVYFNNPDQASDLQTAFVPSTPKPGRVYLNAPSNRIVTQPSQRTGTTTPNFVFQKTNDDEVYIWFRIASLLGSRIAPYNDKLDFESLDYVQIKSLDSGGSNDTGRYTDNLTVFVPGYVGVYVKAGNNNTDYTVVCDIKTVATGPFNQTISLRCLLQIRDLLPI